MISADYITRGKIVKFSKVDNMVACTRLFTERLRILAKKYFQKIPCVIEEIIKRFTSELYKAHILNSVTLVNFSLSTEESVWQLKPKKFKPGTRRL